MKNLNLKVISKYLRPYKKEFLYGALALLVVNILSVVIPLEVNSSRSLPSNKLFRISAFDRLEDIYLLKKNYADKIQFEVSKPDPTKSLFVLEGLKLFDQIIFVFEKSSFLVIFQKFKIFSISFLISISPGKLV